MNPVLATVLLIFLAGVLFTLPLLPALMELRLKRDAQPLNVIQQHGERFGIFPMDSAPTSPIYWSSCGSAWHQEPLRMASCRTAANICCMDAPTTRA